ncbi:MAG: OB-fold domain-containing protein [Deltaproteobacteria bacterium]|nr:OB-fold domain-containing protein [Deltaproteobacteria bacterium]MBW2385058.1 OB-fold domain-containing protein [Deltaproteobacteria bacterium]MBW2696106.1 OB-fold domain-containing protein [Deltaproteobacteria bacterium]
MSDENDDKFMKQVVSVEYDMKPSPEQVAYSKELAQHRIVGQQCPQCRLTYVPGNGYCPICAVAIGEDRRIELEPRGTITSFTVVEPVQYKGQQEKSPYVVAAILLDGAGVALGHAYGGAAQYFAMWVVSDRMPD